MQTRRPPNTSFRQQTMKAWRPILTPMWVIGTLMVVGLLFLPIGAICLVASQGIVEVISVPYDEYCCVKNCGAEDSGRVDRNPCILPITVPETMRQPINMYYMVEGFYQNHRRYVKSRSDEQLRGDVGIKPSALIDCPPRAYADPNGPDTVENAINPCGLIAWSVFNDTFALKKTDGSEVAVSKKGIAWESDVRDKFKNSKETGSNFPPFAGQACEPGDGTCVEDEDFIVWMRTAALPTFRKLYRFVEEDLQPGNYTVVIQNGVGASPRNPATNEPQTTLYPVHTFGGHKYVVLTTTAWIGGKNDFLGYAYMIVGSVSVALALAFLIKHLQSPRILGDTDYLVSWKDLSGQ